MSELEQFGRYRISQHADGSPVIFPRAPGEVICLAYDEETHGLVEVHVLSEGENWSAEDQQSFYERARSFGRFVGPCFPRLIDIGQNDGLPFYTSEVNDGEGLTDYVRRNRRLDIPLALNMVIQLTDAIIEMAADANLMRGLRLANLLIVLEDGAYLTLRITDCGLARAGSSLPDSMPASDAISQIAQILFYLVAGKPFVMGDPGKQLDELAGLPANLKFLLKHALDPKSGSAPKTLEQFRRELRDSYGALSARITSASALKPVAVQPRLFPEFTLHRHLFSDIDLQEHLGDRYQIEEVTDTLLGAYETSTFDTQKERQTIIQFLPPMSVMPEDSTSSIIAAMSRINEERHPNLLRLRGFWMTDRVTFVAEEPVNGFSLQEMLTNRGQCLEPPETVILLRQLVSALRQAEDIHITVRNLAIGSLLVHFPSDSRFRVRELKKRHVDCWPADAALKLRTHPGLTSIIATPPSGRLETIATEPETGSGHNILAKNFVEVAEHLAVGPWPAPRCQPGEEEPEQKKQLRKFFTDAYRDIENGEKVFLIPEFLERLERILGGMKPDKGEVIGTIVDGAAGIQPLGHKKEGAGDTERKKSPLVRETVGGIASASGSKAPGDEEVESLGAIDDGDFVHNVPRTLEHQPDGPGAGDSAGGDADKPTGPVSLGVIDDSEFVREEREYIPPSARKKKRKGRLFW